MQVQDTYTVLFYSRVCVKQHTHTQYSCVLVKHTHIHIYTHTDRYTVFLHAHVGWGEYTMLTEKNMFSS